MLSTPVRPHSDSDSERDDEISRTSVSSSTFSQQARERDARNLELEQKSVQDALRIAGLEAALERQKQIAAKAQQELERVKQENRILQERLNAVTQRMERVAAPPSQTPGLTVAQVELMHKEELKDNVIKNLLKRKHLIKRR